MALRVVDNDGLKLIVSGKEAVNLAVETICTTLNGTSGARALANVLLRAYNAAEQPFDIRDLCMLDQQHEEWVWAILKLRVDGVEPHAVVEDKNAFQSIVDRYWVTAE